MFEASARPQGADALDVIAYGREVATLESSALALLANSLDDSFAQAVSLLLTLRGRTVVTGIGKSGHVARKIAATLASTGSPSLFVHPAEAAHGDLGMLVPGDGLLALSNSGASRELQPILAHAKLLNVPIVGITAHAPSPLADNVDICLLLPQADEACPINLAPTTSTAMMMALGDALAMAAMRVRGVSRDGFEALHPGGTIGARLTRVGTVMHAGAEMPLVSVTAPMREVIVTMTTKSFGAAGVVDAAGQLIGVITDGDLRRHVDELMDACAADVMTRDPVTIGERDFVEDALIALNEHKITSLFVATDDDPRRPVGIVHVHDFLRLGFRLRFAIVVPARFASQRYPGKPLVALRGAGGASKPLVQRSWEAAMAVPGAAQVVIATDDARIADAAAGFGATVVMTPASCANGTERCAAALGALDGDVEIVVNLQGDAPLTPPGFVTELVAALAADPGAAVATPVLRAAPELHRRLLADQREGRVGGTTVVGDLAGHALYFSKAVIPHVPDDRIDDPIVPVHLHIGVYAYRRAALLDYARTPSTALEESEGLEQLRFLACRTPVRLVAVTAPGHDIWELNNPVDVAVIERALAARGIA